jgi:RNA 3'-terminal phosphate cyclase (ATP)
MIIIDGSTLEGGGQLMRTSMAFASLFGTPITIEKIRAGRSKPGLKAQHLTGIELVNKMFAGKLTGGEKDSSMITYTPEKKIATGGEYTADIKTAGSVCLLIQISLPCAIFADDATTFNLFGGTNASCAPTIDYFQNVFIPLTNLNVVATTKIRGFFPRGGGHVEVKVTPLAVGETLKPIVLMDPGKPIRIIIKTFTAGKIPERLNIEMIETATQLLIKEFGDIVPIVVKFGHLDETEAMYSGTGITITLKTSTGCRFGSSLPGTRKKKANELATECAQALIDDWSRGRGPCVDRHMQDQLIILMALAEGKSCVHTGELTLHTKTSIHFATLFTGVKFDITPVNDHTNMITCVGCAHAR